MQSLQLKFLKKLFNLPNILGNIAFYLANLCKFTWRIKVVAHPDYQLNSPYLFAFWHGKQLLPVLQLVQHKTKKIALVSPSQDGSILAAWLAKLGYEVIRGSSRASNVKSTMQMLKKLRAGYSLGFGIDGPIGPLYQVKPGIIYLALKCKIPIVPLVSVCPRKWVVAKAWDRYQIPKPFSKISYYIGKPIILAKDVDITQASIELGYALHRATYQAAKLLTAK